MAEKCLIAASLAALACHPSATIKCFSPKSRTTSPQREKQKPPPMKKVHSKYEKKENPRENSSSSAIKSNTNLPSPPPPSLPPSTSRTDKLLKAVSELGEGNPSVGVVQTIFRSGWPKEVGLTIQKVLKVNHSASVLNNFDDCRKKVKCNAANTCHGKLMERLIVDGNELLRFKGALITCSLGSKGYSRNCEKKCCGICRMITSSFKVEDEPISVHESSWKAHEKVINEYGARRVYARKAIVLCRVIAGRVSPYQRHGLGHGEDGSFDSAVDQSNGSEELLVLNPRAVLPCFVVLYDVS